MEGFPIINLHHHGFFLNKKGTVTYKGGKVSVIPEFDPWNWAKIYHLHPNANTYFKNDGVSFANGISRLYGFDSATKMVEINKVNLVIDVYVDQNTETERDKEEVISGDIYLHHHDHFRSPPSINYIGGNVKMITDLNCATFGFGTLEEFAQKYFYSSNDMVYYKLFGDELVDAYRLVYDKVSIRDIVGYCKSLGRIDLYVEHREPTEVIAPDCSLEPFFTINLHHLGEFKDEKGIVVYKGGQVEVINDFNPRNWIQLLGHYPSKFLYFKNDGVSFVNGVRMLYDEKSAQAMVLVHKGLGNISLYADHCEIEEAQKCSQAVGPRKKLEF